MAPTAIRWYKFINDGTGVVAYPQLRGSGDAPNTTIWDPRSKKELRYMIAVGALSQGEA